MDNFLALRGTNTATSRLLVFIVAALTVNMLVSLSSPSTAVAKAQQDERQFVSLSPARVVITAQGGSSVETTRLTLLNNTSDDLNVRVDVVGLVADADGSSFTDIAAKDTPEVAWVKTDWRGGVVGSGDRVAFTAKIRPPAGATPGTHVVGITVSQTVSTTASNTDGKARVSIDASAVAQILIDVPGRSSTDFDLKALDAPIFVRAGDDPSFRVRATNSGTNLLDGSVYLILDNPLGSSYRLKHDLPPVLPGGHREIEMKWENVPLIGWYTPRVTLTTDQETETITLGRVYVIPPWWMFLIAAAALAAAVTSRILRR